MEIEKLSSLNLDFDRVLIQLVIPGLTSCFPWIIFFLNTHHFERDYLLKNLTLLITITTIISLIAGIILENLGSLVEKHFYDVRNKKSDPQFFVIWEKFLCLSYGEKTPIGHRYLRNILLRMKFELSFAFAMLPMIVGLALSDHHTTIFESGLLRFIFFYMLPVAITIYLLCFEAYSSSKILAGTRKMLVEKYSS